MDRWIGRVQELVAEVVELDPTSVGPDSHVAELGLDSIGSVELLWKIEERFDVRIPPEDAIHLTTVRAFARYMAHQAPR
jgi:acyl carrier protein